MEQRRVRLGDIVDDYCTRERRVTNHAVVAMIEDQIQLTRCTTCDTEHPYKAARVPRKRKKTETGVLYEQVLAGRDRETLADVEGPADGRLAAAAPEDEARPDAGQDGEPSSAEPGEGAGLQPDTPVQEDGPVRRPLIRATLPRPEGQQTTRPAPEFTIRQPGTRGGFRGDIRGDGRSGRPSNNGGRPGFLGQGQPRPGGRSGFGHGRQGAASAQAGSRQDRHPGPRHDRPAPHARSGKKRSR
jgi:hypothetical protein